MHPIKHRSFIPTISGLTVLCATALAVAQPNIEPISMERRVCGRAQATNGVDSDDTGLIVDETDPSDFSFWSGSVFGSATVPAGGTMSFSAAYQGGFASDSFTIITSSATVGGGGPPGNLYSGHAEQFFEATFTITRFVSYELDYDVGGAALAAPGATISLRRVGEATPIIEDTAAPPTGTVTADNLTGTLTPGDYVLHVSARSEVIDIPGGGGGNAIIFFFHVDPEPLIQPTAQDRRLFGQATATDGVTTDDTGLLVDSPAPGDFGVWTGAVAGTAEIPLMGNMTFNTTYTGGFNGDDTISIDTGNSTGTVSGGGGPGITLTGLQGQVFQMTFTIPIDVDYTLSYFLNGASLVPGGGNFYLERVGELDPIVEDGIAPPAGGIDISGLTGSLAPGDYTINIDIASEANIVGPGGGGGGNAMFVTFQVEPAAPDLLGDLNCDGQLDTDDIGPFALALTDPAEYAVQFPACDINLANTNQDAAIDGLDVGSFVSILTP